MGEMIVGAVWLVIGGALVWHFAITRRRRRQRGNMLREHAEHERTIHESRASGYAGPDRRTGGGPF